MIDIDITKVLKATDGDMKLSCSLNINDGEFVALSGKSGSGKTTLLRILSGLEDAHGTIKVNGKVWLEKSKSLSPQHREIGFVFQDYALFSNMSVRENLFYVNKDEALLKRLLDITELGGLEDRLPHTLSGGQKQRVALCRALIGRPKLLLMDEPLSALEYDLRVKLQNEIKILHKEFQTTTIMVSHDSSEIYRLADRVVILEDGKVIKNKTIKEVFLNDIVENKMIFKAEILDIVKDYNNYKIVLLVEQNILNVTISKDESKMLNIGQSINIKADSLTLIF